MPPESRQARRAGHCERPRRRRGARTRRESLGRRARRARVTARSAPVGSSLGDGLRPVGGAESQRTSPASRAASIRYHTELGTGTVADGGASTSVEPDAVTTRVNGCPAANPAAAASADAALGTNVSRPVWLRSTVPDMVSGARLAYLTVSENVCGWSTRSTCCAPAKAVESIGVASTQWPSGLVVEDPSISTVDTGCGVLRHAADRRSASVRVARRRGSIRHLRLTTRPRGARSTPLGRCAAPRAAPTAAISFATAAARRPSRAAAARRSK
jgi:hypothetical protein